LSFNQFRIRLSQNLPQIIIIIIIIIICSHEQKSSSVRSYLLLYDWFIFFIWIRIRLFYYPLFVKPSFLVLVLTLPIHAVTTRHFMVNAVLENNNCLFWKAQENFKITSVKKNQRFVMLKHRVHIVTTVLQNVHLMRKYGIKISWSFIYMSKLRMSFNSIWSMHYSKKFILMLQKHVLFYVPTRNKEPNLIISVLFILRQSCSMDW
jgi:hypothetical protein